MAWVMAAAQVAGYGMTALSQRKEGAVDLREGLIAADTLERNAGQERAYSQRRAIEKRREARLLESRAKAVAGGSASDPSVRKILTDIESEGEMRAMLELYEGDVTAQGMESQAASARRGGKDALKGAYTRSAGTVLEGVSSLYDKYGGRQTKRNRYVDGLAQAQDDWEKRTGNTGYG